MAGTAIYLASLDREPPGMKFRTTIMLLAVVSILVAIALYATSQTVDVVTEALGSNLTLTSLPVIIISTAIYIFFAVLGLLRDANR